MTSGFTEKKHLMNYRKMIVDLMDKKVRQMEIAKETGLSQGHISHISRGYFPQRMDPAKAEKLKKMWGRVCNTEETGKKTAIRMKNR